MKKLKAIIPTGGAPLGQFPVLRDIFDSETKNAIEAMLSSVIIGETQGVILSGCLATGTAGAFSISAGYIFVDGEVLEFLGSGGHSSTKYLKKAAVTEESGVFADGGTKAYIDVNQADQFSSSGGGAGTQYVTLAFATPGQTLAARMGDFINADSVDGSKIADESINSEHYADGSIDDEHLADARVKSVGVQLLTKILEIGDWNMDSFGASSLIIHGITLAKIRSVTAIIRNDADTVYNSLEGLGEGGSSAVTSTIQLTRLAAGAFDTTDYDSTSYNRGWITVTYEA